MNNLCKYCGTSIPKRQSYCSNDCHCKYRLSYMVEHHIAMTKYQAATYMRKFVNYECKECGINKWCNKPLRLQLDHIDGDINNNDIKNLRWLCPNCHTQTPTWGVKNVSPEGKIKMTLGGIKGNASTIKKLRDNGSLG